MSGCQDAKRRRDENCKRWRDDGYEDCREYRDEGYSSCDRWDQECCDWWPCSWACKLITWICIAWTWVSNVVCVFVVWVRDLVCVAWNLTIATLCVVADAAIAALGVVFETLESILGWVLSAIAFVIEAMLNVPILGRLVGWVLAAVQTIAWFIVGAVDTVAGLLGIRPEKKLRICTIILADENGQPIVPASSVIPWLQWAVRIYRQEANVRVLPVAPFQYSTGFDEMPIVTEEWIHVRSKPSPSRILDLGGEAATLGSDLIDIGSHYNAIANVESPYGAWRRLTGYGAPITIFVIRSLEEGIARSLGPLTDYLVVGGRQRISVTDVAHEMGHACSLVWHDANSGNLMYEKNPRGAILDGWQTLLVRSSRHVTYF